MAYVVLLRHLFYEVVYMITKRLYLTFILYAIHITCTLEAKKIKKITRERRNDAEQVIMVL